MAKLKRKLIILVLILVIAYLVYFALTSCRRPSSSPDVTPTSTVRTLSPIAVILSRSAPSGWPSRTLLRWIAPGGDPVLDGNVLQPGKVVALEEIFNDDTGPEYFDVFEVYDSILDWWIGRGESLSPPKVKFNAERVGNWIAHSDRVWQLPAPSEFRGQSTFVFRDDREKQSGSITSTSLVKIDFRFIGELLKQFLTKGAGPLQVRGGVEIEGSLIFATDPTVSLVLLVPWGTAETNLNDYLWTYLKYLSEFNREIDPETLMEQVRGYLPSEQPKGWELTMSPREITGSPSKPGTFILTLRTPTPGKTLLAIKVIESGNPSHIAVSEIIGIEALPIDE